MCNENYPNRLFGRKNIDMANYLEIDSKTYNYKLSGKTDFTMREIILLHSICCCTYDELFTEIERIRRNRKNE